MFVAIMCEHDAAFYMPAVKLGPDLYTPPLVMPFWGGGDLKTRETENVPPLAPLPFCARHLTTCKGV